MPQYGQLSSGRLIFKSSITLASASNDRYNLASRFDDAFSSVTFVRIDLPLSLRQPTWRITTLIPFDFGPESKR